MVKIVVDPGAGFCFGVDEVIRTAESLLKKGEQLYGLGEMVHNAEEMKRLGTLGLRTIDHSRMNVKKPGKVLFRAHGEPPSTYRLAKELGVDIIDGTCPIVARLQKKLNRVYDIMDHDSEQLVIFGKPDHPETIGLLGQVGGHALVVTTMDDIKKIDPDKNVFLFSQTTMDPDQFREMERGIKAFLKKGKVDRKTALIRSDCTICGQMKKRKPGLATFARKYEVILFVSGRNSSNGKMLYQFCRSLNPDTHWISGSDDLELAWLEGRRSIGISGATSTSREQLESVASQVRMLTSSLQ